MVVGDDGEEAEVIEAVPCRRCADSPTPVSPAATKTSRVWVILCGASTHDPKEEHVGRHTVEYTFEAEEVLSVAGKYADLTLFRGLEH